MSIRQVPVRECDFCQQKIPDKYGTIKGKDACEKCLKELMNLVEEEYRRVFQGQVRDRRGGWRQLGSYDG